MLNEKIIIQCVVKFYQDIKAAKKCQISSLIENSDNKIKTIWDIANLLTGKKKNSNDIHQINIDGTLTSNSQIISNYFNNYFLPITEYRIPIAKNNNPIDYLYQAFKEPFPTIKYQNTSTTEIEKIIESLKVKDPHGYDEISVKILELSSPFISSPLNYISNKLLSFRIFP
jgi:hypothetical protein